MTDSKQIIWKTGRQNNELVHYLTDILDCNPISAKMLINRSITSIDEVKTFFSTDLKKITPPWKIKDIEKSCSRIYKAILNNENILIFGDYDTDGITSICVLYLFLKPYVKNLSYFIPHREKDGYGFSKKHVKAFVNKNINLIITVDCGSSNEEAIKEALNNNIDTIVTDHHNIPSIPKSAYSVVNPKRKDCSSCLDNLAGVGVAFYLIIALRKTLRENNFYKNRQEPNLSSYTDLVALGTIADIMPMTKENRIFTKTGLKILKTSPRKSLYKLLKASGVDNRYVTSQDLGFIVCPRLNSAGRIDDANQCVKLITSDDNKTINDICSNLNLLNSKRKKMEDEIVLDITKKVNQKDLTNSLLIFHSQKWAQGILGTAASKMTSKFNLPCILFTQKDSMLKGSARSIDGFSIYALLEDSRDYLEKFGGHSQAAGITMNFEKFKDFYIKAQEYAKKEITPDIITPVHEAEDVVLFDQLSKTFLNELDLFEPFGVDNPYPLFIVKNVIVEKNIRIKNIHSRLNLYQPNCVFQNKLTGFIFNNDKFIPSHLDQILVKPVPDKLNRDIPNLFIEAWQ